MNIGILLRELDVSGGTQRQAICLARELQNLGDEVSVFAQQVDAGRCFPDLLRGLTVVPLSGHASGRDKAPWLLRTFRRFSGDSPAFRAARRIAAELPGDLDVLNVHEYDAYLAAIYWKRITGKPIVWMMNDFPQELCLQWNPRRPWRRIERLLDGKAWETRRRRAMVREFDKVLALSDMEGAKFTREIGIAAETVVSGLDVDAFDFKPRTAPHAGPLRLFSNAMLYPHRRMEDIIDAVVILLGRGIDLSWVHAGDLSRAPSYAASVRRRIADAGLGERVRLLGSVSDARLVREFQAADIFLFPNTPQSWGLAVFQAMACGTPVIVSRGAGASEVLTHGKNALLVNPFSPLQIADAVEELRMNRALWQNLHGEGRRFVVENIRWDLYAGRMRVIFARVAFRDVP